MFCENFQKINFQKCTAFILILLSTFTIGNAQCDQNYDWASWANFTGTSATGTINNGGQTISVTMTANYNFNSTGGIFNFGAFNGFNGTIPNTTVPRTEWSAGAGGVTTMCFSEVVSNPVLLLSSLGSPGTMVNLQLSRDYIPIYDGGGMSFVNDTTIIGEEGYAILVFPGNFDCITIFSSTPEYYTNITWGLNPPLFPVSITGDSIDCDSVTLIASGGNTYTWSGGANPTSAINTFYTSGNYFLTVTDAIGCTVVTSAEVQIDSSLCVDCAGTPNGTAIFDECGECLQPNDPNFNQSCADCAGVPNGTAILDECGECLQPNDPNFNQSCADCAGTPNGTAIFDECGECLQPTDPNFNQSCADCAGTPNGTAIFDECGECLEPSDPNFNQSCADCTGTPNGTAIFDECGECLQPNDPNFNQSCADCAGTPNGTAIFDECGECLEPTDPNFNQSCADCTGTPNGTTIFDECGECFEATDPNFNQSCTDCAGVPNGTALLNECGLCLEPTDSNFNLSCLVDKFVYIPNAFSPNDDGSNDVFRVFPKLGINAQVIQFLIFDRWGNNVYKSNNFEINSLTMWWDGTFKGEKMQAGVFVYYLQIAFDDGEVKAYKGHVTLIK